jgi:transcriptional regulator
MHPNPAFRHDDRMLFETLIDEIGFGMIFAETPDGPRVAHTPVWSTGDGALQFHLARGNALSRHVAGRTALAVVNGPDAYVSARWYDEPGQIPTWNYVALELEGPVRRMAQEGLLALLTTLTERHEGRVGDGGEPWTIDKLSDERLRTLMKGIVGFEMEVRAWRPTLKLSQNKSREKRERIADILEAQGSPAVAHLMRTLAP